MAISGVDVAVKLSGVATAFTDEAMTTDGGRKTYTITDSTKAVWDPTAAVTVETSTDGGTTWVAAAAGSYTLNRLSGQVIFNAQQAAGTDTRVSGKYLPMTTVAEAHSYTDTGSLGTSEVTPFGAKFKTFIPEQLDVSGDLADFNVTDTYYSNALANSSLVVLEFSDSVEITRYWALLTKDEVKAAVGSPADASVSWQGVKDADGRVMSIV